MNKLRLRSGFDRERLVVIKEFQVYSFKPLNGTWAEIHKRKLKVYFDKYNETDLLFEYTVSRSDPPKICYGKRVYVEDFDWMLRRGIEIK